VAYRKEHRKRSGYVAVLFQAMAIEWFPHCRGRS